MRVIDTGYVDEVMSLAFAPHGGALAVGTRSRGATVHDLTAGAMSVRLDDGTHLYPWCLAFGAGGRAVYGITERGRIEFDPATGRAVAPGPTDPSLPGRVQGFVEAGDGSRLVTKHYHFPATRLAAWTPAEGGWGLAWVVEQGNSSGPALLGDRVVQIGSLNPAGWNYQLIVYDAVTGGVVGTGAYDYGMLARAHARPDGRQIVAPHEMTLVVWDARVLGKPVLVRNDSRRHFTAAAYHPSGRYLFTTSNDATVTVWDTDNWTRVKRFDWEIGRLRSVAVSADGLLAAAGSDRGRVVVWDVDV